MKALLKVFGRAWRARQHQIFPGGEGPPHRPDVLDLIGPEFDVPNTRSADRTLIICSAPRTGSYELCRLLAAAGIGVPHEYFHPNYARKIASRWQFDRDPLDPTRLGQYIEALRKKRSNSGIFAFKLQLWQFNHFLRNPCGAELFEAAHVVHLFRPDVTQQFLSYRLALTTGRWDFSPRATTSPEGDGTNEALKALDRLVSEDAGLRRLFVLLGLHPLFLTTDDLTVRPRETVERIAAVAGVLINRPGLDAMLKTCGRYADKSGNERRLAGAAGSLRDYAFRRE